MVPSWDDLVERNRASAKLPLQATVYDSGVVSKGWGVQRLQFEPPNRWRVEDDDGVVSVMGARESFTRLDDGRTQRGRPWIIEPGIDVGTMWPMLYHGLRLMVMWKLWRPMQPEFIVSEDDDGGLANRSGTAWVWNGSGASPASWSPASQPRETELRGRRAWTVDVWYSHPQGTYTIPWTFDDETGVVIGRKAGEMYDVTELGDLVVGEPIADSVFTYGGDVVETVTVQAERAEAQRRQAEERRIEDAFRAAYGKGNSVDRYLDNEFGTVLVRTDFSDDQAWRDLVDYVTTDRDGLMGAGFAVIDNDRYAGWAASDFLDEYRVAPRYIVIAGPAAFTHPDRPVIYIEVRPSDPDALSPRGTTCSVAASGVALLQVNLDISNTSLGEQAPDSDGIVRMEWLG